jgi:hypothetical protein
VPLILLRVDAHEAMKNFEKALEDVELAREIVCRGRGEGHFDLVEVLDHEGGIYLIQEKWTEAERVFTNALRIVEKTKGSNSTEYG